jgi:hypothetical protein
MYVAEELIFSGRWWKYKVENSPINLLGTRKLTVSKMDEQLSSYLKTLFKKINRPGIAAWTGVLEDLICHHICITSSACRKSGVMQDSRFPSVSNLDESVYVMEFQEREKY